ncbi:MAG: hypothetical protein ACYTFA_07385 [Planctomycetota bacterium]
MPFGSYFDGYYTNIYAPAITDAGLKPTRADDLYRPSTIVSDIWTQTNQAKLVLADLTGKNPNVFYELGLAHALAKPAILVTASMEDVPFDLRALRGLHYDKNQPRWGDTLKQNIVQAIQEIMAEPALSIPTAFIATTRPKSEPKVTPEAKESLSLRRDFDNLRRQVDSPTVRYQSMLDPREARARIAKYTQMGVPTAAIIERLTDAGVPESFIRANLRRAPMPLFEPPSLDPSPATKPPKTKKALPKKRKAKKALPKKRKKKHY